MGLPNPHTAGFNDARYGGSGADAHSLHPHGHLTGRRDWGKIIAIGAAALTVLASLAFVFFYGLYHLILKAFA